MPDILDEPNTEKIETIYAYLSVDERGFNGIVAGLIPGIGGLPLVTASRHLAEGPYRSLANEAALLIGMKIAMYAFERRKDNSPPLWESKP